MRIYFEKSAKNLNATEQLLMARSPSGNSSEKN
nr:MAG TPA: hypothetical protein [Caudoviricetes sp.]